jgi:hypothetical protein
MVSLVSCMFYMEFYQQILLKPYLKGEQQFEENRPRKKVEYLYNLL